MVKKQTTKDLIAESTRELMEKIPFERITVRDIIQNCELSSTTFYKHFRDKYDVIEWIYRRESRIFIDKISDKYTWKDAALETVYNFLDNIDYYRSYFRSDRHADDLNMITYANALDTIRKLHGEECLNDDIRFIARLYFSGVTKMTVEWLLDERTDVTPKQLVQRIMDAMPEVLRRLLF